MSMQADPPERTAQAPSGAGTRLPAIARYWWLTALRGLVALALALAITVRGTATGSSRSTLLCRAPPRGLVTVQQASVSSPGRCRAGRPRPSRPGPPCARPTGPSVVRASFFHRAQGGAIWPDGAGMPDTNRKPLSLPGRLPSLIQSTEEG